MSEIEKAVSILRADGLVAFPTETVYGLGGDATSGSAVEKIFAAKGRPSTNPLICHVADEAMARKYATEWPLAASRIIERFWPGPITIVVKKTAEIPPNVTAGLNSVGLRAPAHDLTLDLIRAFNKPIAGPSANRSNHVSPTTAQHVRDELGDRIDMILDGGPCTVGIESTVLDLTTEIPTILRPGGVTRSQIEEVVGRVDVRTHALDASAPASSPGQQAVHYAPRSPCFHFHSSDRSKLPERAVVLPLSGEPRSYARAFYAQLRTLDAAQPRAIYIELPPDAPEWVAVRDRILRASRPLP